MISVHDLHVKCDLCHKRFKDQTLVRNHKLRVHKTKIHFKCMLCDFTHSHAKPIESHYKAIHGRLEDLLVKGFENCYVQVEEKMSPEPQKPHVEVKQEVMDFDQVRVIYIRNVLFCGNSP